MRMGPADTHPAMVAFCFPEAPAVFAPLLPGGYLNFLGAKPFGHWRLRNVQRDLSSSVGLPISDQADASVPELYREIMALSRAVMPGTNIAGESGDLLTL